MKVRIVVAVLIAASCAWPAVVGAAPRAWLALGGGVAQYDMRDINTVVDYSNIGLSGMNTPQRMRRLSSGSVFGGAAGVDLGRRWAVGVGYERLAGSVRTLSPYGYYQFDLPADLVRGFARFETGGRGRVRHFVEAGAGGLWSAGKYFQVPGPLFPPQPRYTCRGSGPVLDAGLGLRVAATRSVGSEVFAGYRYAVIGRMTGSTTTESFTFRRADQENMRFDYSGLFARAALTLRFGTADDPGR